MPILSHHDEELIGGGDPPGNLLENQGRNRLNEVVQLLFLGLVAPRRRIAAHLLANTPEVQPSPEPSFVKVLAWLAHEDQMSLIPVLGQSIRQLSNADAETARERVLIRTFE